MGGGRGTGKQRVPEETPNPVGRNKPIRARAWKGKCRGSARAEDWGQVGLWAEGLSPAGEQG